jgi:GNAT superfamily N-acetyltransferase
MLRRWWSGLRAASKAANARALRERGETAESLVIREATVGEIPALARLHVTTWNATHRGPFGKGPSYEVRERQWREAFTLTDGSWFCFVVENRKGELVGFAKGVTYAQADQPDYAGELSKIYLLREYQRLGLGRRLMGQVARRFLSQGISSMLLFGTAGNPACRFYAALGGENLVSPTGKVSGNFGWRDLRKLAALCPGP